MFLIYQRFPVIFHDIIMVMMAWALAIVIRYDWPLAPEVETIFWQVLPLVVSIQGFFFWYHGLHLGIWRFASLPDLVTILRSVIIGTLAIVLVLVLFNRLERIPRSSLIFYPFILIFLLGMPRLLYRLWYQHSLHFALTHHPPQRVLVLGAGTSGDFVSGCAV